MIAPIPQIGMVRLLAAGSVDDGKSTLIGRLLYEADGIYEDQLTSVRKASGEKRGGLDLSLLTDGLKAEREQNITIDVAYRYFSTSRRKFIIADAPGHEQYTRNMITGASTADIALLLVDARKGILTQTRRHAYVVWLLGIRRLIVAINKMDLIDYNEGEFQSIKAAFAENTPFIRDLTTYFVPVSALNGDNVVRCSNSIRWYDGPTLLELLDTIPVETDRNLEDFRFAVQNVIRPDQNFRGYAGQICSGSVEPGQEVMVLPSRQRTKIEQVILYEQLLKQAHAPRSVVLTLAHHVDVGRGDMLVDPRREPTISNRFKAELIWMSSKPMIKDVPYLIKHTTQLLCCHITRLLHRLNVDTFRQDKSETLGLNEIGLAEIETHKSMFFDSYSKNRATGNFIIIDPATNDTVAAGVIPEDAATANIGTWADTNLTAVACATSGLVVWFTGLSGAGKSTICKSAAIELMAMGFRVEVLDADEVRKGLCSDLGFTREDRIENVRRLGFVAQLLAQHGVIVLVAAISPYRSAREELRRVVSNYLEVFVNAPLAVCEQRDPKGLYKRARSKSLKNFTGIDDPYEPPLSAEVECLTECESVTASTSKVVAAIAKFFEARSYKNIPVMGSHVGLDVERQSELPEKGCMSHGS